MLRKNTGILKKIVLGILVLILIFISYFFIGSAPAANEISFGVNFSQKHAQNLDLDWKETYLALLDDLKVRNIKLITHWDLIEPERGKYNFEDLDWQITEAEKRNVEILLVIGMKTPRWPECHIPDWAKNLNKEEQQKSILKLIKEIVLIYKESSAIRYWQVENEPFFPFGECPWVGEEINLFLTLRFARVDKEFLKKEIDEVKLFDPEKRPVVISDSGEFSLWLRAAGWGDIVGSTLHRKVWFKEVKTYISYPLPAVFYWRRAQLIKKLFGKEVIIGELQAEPWCPNLIYNCGISEQEKTMNLEQFKKNIEFAGKTGLKEIYLWGGEWWYWLKETRGDSKIWDEAKKLF